MIARYILIGFSSGVLFGVMDGVLNGNPLARRLLQVFDSIARQTINIPAGVLIDLLYGFVMAALFLLLYRSLPGADGWVKGLSFGLIIWFFRVVMQSASYWMMFEIPPQTLFYLLAAGLLEMIVLGLFYGLTLKPL